MKNLQKTYPELEIECVNCAGSGGFNEPEAGWVNCSKCDGAGHIPTEFGKDMLSLVLHNAQTIVERAGRMAERSNS